MVSHTGEGSLSPKGQKVPSPYPRVAMKIVAPRETAETTKVPEAVNKGAFSLASKVIIQVQYIRVSCYTDRLDRKGINRPRLVCRLA